MKRWKRKRLLSVGDREVREESAHGIEVVVSERQALSDVPDFPVSERKGRVSPESFDASLVGEADRLTTRGWEGRIRLRRGRDRCRWIRSRETRLKEKTPERSDHRVFRSSMSMIDCWEVD